MKPSTDILQRLKYADRAWRRTRARESFLRAIKWGCAILALLVVVDLIFQLGSSLRLLFGLAAVFTVVGFLIRNFFEGEIKEGPKEKIARLLEDRDQSLGSKLMNVLQLEAQTKDDSQHGLTRKLAQRAIDDASAELEDRDFVPLTGSETMGRSAKRALIPVACVLVPALIFSGIAMREVMRYIDPFGDHPPFSFTTLEIITPDESGVAVVYNQPTTVEVEFSGHRPKELFLTIENAEDPAAGAIEVPMFPQGEKRFVQQIDQVQTDLMVRAHTKSKRSRSENREIGVILTPQLESTAVTIVPPIYTGQPKRTLKIDLNRGTAPSVSVLTGSQVSFELTSNRPLSESAAGLVTTSSPKPEELKMTPGIAEQENTATVGFTALESGRIKFDLRDVTGLSSDKDLTANLVVTHDLPPEITRTEPLHDGYIVDTHSTMIAFRATDDYGLERMRVHVGVNEKFRKPDIIDMQVAPVQLEALESVEISPRKMGSIPGDTIFVFADVIDNRPEPQMARSETLALQVISEEQYNDYMRMQTEISDLENKYATLHDEMKELADAQRELAKKAEETKAEDASPEKRDELAAEQSELNQKLEKLAEKMENATRDQPLYDLEKDLQKVLNEEAEKIRESVAENQEQLESFLAGEKPSAESMEKFSEAGEKQADKLDPAREEAEQKIAEALDDAQKMQDLLKAVNAYEQLYEAQEELAKQTQPYADETEFSQEDKLALQEMAGVERDISEGLAAVEKALREGADAAEELYPEAAQDARNIADAIHDANLSNLASGSAKTMLTGNGDQSHDKAEHLRSEMEKLIGECQECKGGGASEEFTQRLKMMRSMMAGDTFSQMAQCKKFGNGKGTSPGGMGQGMGGMSGTGQSQMGEQKSLLGGESNLGQRGTGPESANSGDGRTDDVDSTELEKARKGERNGEVVKRELRPAKSVTGDLLMNEYDDVVDAYFKKLTTEKKEKSK